MPRLLSGRLARAFLRGVSLPDVLIEYPPSLLNQTIQFFSRFIFCRGAALRFAIRLVRALRADEGVAKRRPLRVRRAFCRVSAPV